MRLTIFGANGATGRVLVRQALDAGHHVVAVTRHPGEFPVRHGQLVVAQADVHDGPAVTSAIEGSAAVLSALGVPFTRQPVTVYSDGAARIAAAMSRLGVKRLAVVSSTAVDPHPHPDGGYLLNHVAQPIIARTIGRTTYADMRAMESLLAASDLDWTVLRPGGLFDAPRVTAYQVSEHPLPGAYTSRADLAACLLAQAGDGRGVRKIIEVTTTEGTPTLWQVIRREAFGKS
jgi:putative NADH-flavin reductase